MLDSLEANSEARDRLWANTTKFRKDMENAGFSLAGAGAPIVPIMIGDAPTAVAMADQLLHEGVFVTAFSFPVVPKGNARIRAQLSAAHIEAQMWYPATI